MHRSTTILLALLMVCSISLLVSAAENESTIGCGITEASKLTSLQWNYESPAHSPSEGLLLGAKALMKGIYTYAPDTPDYLPTSYTNQDQMNTNYTKHAVVGSSVFWKTDNGTQLQWVSEPGSVPKGWSGIVKTAGPVEISGNAEHLQCYTDCSGFVTSLFTYANTVAPTKFTSWKEGIAIPEAGCNDPNGSCVEPNPLSYYIYSSLTIVVPSG